MEDIKDDNEMISRFMNNVFTMWVNPEIEKRRAANSIAEGFALDKFQVIMNMGQGNEVRFNEEIKVVALCEAKGAVEKGQMIYMDEIARVKEFRLTEKDANAGHITGLLLDGVWNISFNFKYNSAKRMSILKRAYEFFLVAEFSLAQGLFRAFHENMFSMMESLVMVCLISAPDERLLAIRTHGSWKSKINSWSKLGNVKAEYTKLFNVLCDQRETARYAIEEFSMDFGQAQEMLAVAKAFYDELESDIPKIDKVS